MILIFPIYHSLGALKGKGVTNFHDHDWNEKKYYYLKILETVFYVHKKLFEKAHFVFVAF